MLIQDDGTPADPAAAAAPSTSGAGGGSAPASAAVDGAESTAADLLQLGQELLPSVGTLLGALGVALAIWIVGFWVLQRAAGRTRFKVDNILARNLRRPAGLLLPLLAVQMVVPALGLSEAPSELLRHGLSIGLIITVAWVLLRVVASGQEVMLGRHDISARDNLQARRIRSEE
ncbi:MAG: hypothetical protein ACF8R7_12610, partial [Phycisphaerales bacterium JB039]